MEFDNLHLEHLLSNLNAQAKEAFVRWVMKTVNGKKELLKVYYGCDMSLKKSSEQLFLHKKTHFSISWTEFIQKVALIRGLSIMPSFCIRDLN